jgi:hypothetical protein
MTHATNGWDALTMCAMFVFFGFLAYQFLREPK